MSSWALCKSSQESRHHRLMSRRSWDRGESSRIHWRLAFGFYAWMVFARKWHKYDIAWNSFVHDHKSFVDRFVVINALLNSLLIPCRIMFLLIKENIKPRDVSLFFFFNINIYMLLKEEAAWFESSLMQKLSICYIYKHYV